jgi:hypothetical protein
VQLTFSPQGRILLLKDALTAERLREVLSYDPKEGVFVWRVSPTRRVKAGAIAGSTNNRGYRRIGIDGKSYHASRLAWFYIHGEWPEREIDHRNVDPSDNRISNLRLATRSENCANKRRAATNSSGMKGVVRRRDMNKWHAKIWKNGVHYHLGYFSTPEAAHAAYSKAANDLFGEFARTA